MKIAPLAAILFLICSFTYSQNLIGHNGKDIRRYMRDHRKDMNFNTVRNSEFSYLKYSDNSDNQTILFFLTPDSVCKSVRVICDSMLKPEKIKEFDAAYKKIGNNAWMDNRNGKNYLIALRDEKWSCTITIEPVK
jgi:hypothetical protein